MSFSTFEPQSTVQISGRHVAIDDAIDDVFGECAAACFECSQSCTTCILICLQKQDSLIDCIQIDRQCADACDEAGRLLRAGDNVDREQVRRQLERCIGMCRRCAEQNERFRSIENYCQVSAESCRECESACQRVLEFLFEEADKSSTHVGTQ